MAYNVYLGQVGSDVVEAGAKESVRQLLLSWFNQIAQGTSYGSATVTWVSTAPSVQAHELLVYFVATRGQSVVRYLPGGTGSIPDNADGHTEWTAQQTASEVYVSRSEQYLAEMAFHELMHNKLHRGASLHQMGGPPGLARVPVEQGRTPSQNEIAQMRSHLSDNHPQWTGGWNAGLEF